MFRYAVICLLVLLPRAGIAGDITVFSAASLTDAMTEAAQEWGADTGHTVRFSFGSSGSLARQIEAGAPADIFLSANVGWMDYLVAEGWATAQTRRVIARNSLVVIAPSDSASPLPTLTDIPTRLADNRLSLANTQSAPVGQYSRAALEALDIWEDVAPQVIQADNVRAALLFVSRGEAALGMVYITDARIDPGVTVVATIPSDLHTAIEYPAAVMTESENADIALNFLNYLSSPEGQAHFAAYGFGSVN